MAFDNTERDILLMAPRIGPRVVRRLEEAGIDSFDKLRSVGIDTVVQAICHQVGSVAWANRRTPLKQALASTLGGPDRQAHGEARFDSEPCSASGKP